MDLDCYVSFGPVMVYSKDKQVLLSKANKDKILVETDGPVRFSRCFENKTAQIDFIPSIVFCASKVLHVNYDELLEKLYFISFSRFVFSEFTKAVLMSCFLK